MARLLPTVEINLEKLGGTVKVDGHEIPCVQRIRLDSTARKVPMVTLDIYSGTVSVMIDGAEVDLGVIEAGVLARRR